LQVHAYIISSLKKDMPAVFGKEAKKKELIKNLDALYASLQRVRPPDPILNSCQVFDSSSQCWRIRILTLPTHRK
jgi:hypothetical protein